MRDNFFWKILKYPSKTLMKLSHHDRSALYIAPREILFFPDVAFRRLYYRRQKVRPPLTSTDKWARNPVTLSKSFLEHCLARSNFFTWSAALTSLSSRILNLMFTRSITTPKYFGVWDGAVTLSAFEAELWGCWVHVAINWTTWTETVSYGPKPSIWEFYSPHRMHTFWKDVNLAYITRNKFASDWIAHLLIHGDR